MDSLRAASVPAAGRRGHCTKVRVPRRGRRTRLPTCPDHTFPGREAYAMTTPRLNRLSVALLAAILGLPATAVLADDQSADREGEGDVQKLEDITVTARRRSENIQEVPVAVSAFGSEELKDMQAKNIDGLQGAVPNLNIVQGRGSSNAVNVFIRGIGQPDALQTFDPGVGMYVDDVYFSRIQGALFGLHDVERVEVLRGPQGTLYGKNSTGGAIKLV